MEILIDSALFLSFVFRLCENVSEYKTEKMSFYWVYPLLTIPTPLWMTGTSSVLTCVYFYGIPLTQIMAVYELVYHHKY